MSFDKTKFTRDPQLDSEGFFDATSQCLGCDGNEPCPRSGHCPRYNSPLRFYNNQTITVQINPPGWREVDGVKLPPVDGWAEQAQQLRQECQSAYEAGFDRDVHEEMFRG